MTKLRSDFSLLSLASLALALSGCGCGGGSTGGARPQSLTKLTIIDSIIFTDNKVPAGTGPDGKFAYGIQGDVGDTSIEAAGKTYAIPEQSTIEGSAGTVVRADANDGGTWLGHLDSSTLKVVIDKSWPNAICDFVTEDGWSLNDTVDPTTNVETFAVVSPTGTATDLTIPAGFSPVQMSSKFVLISNAARTAVRHSGPTGSAFFAGRQRATKAAVNRGTNEFRVITPTTSFTLQAPAGVIYYQASSVSLTGTTAGLTFNADGSGAGIIWDAQGTPTTLPSLDPTDTVQASSINKDGIVVGTETDESGTVSTGVIWQKGVIKPQSAFITSSSIDAFDSIDDAWKVLAQSADGTFYLLQGS